MSTHRVGNKRTPPSESYSHPLIKSIDETAMEDHSRILPTYQPILPSHRNRTSTKVLRCSTLTPSLGGFLTAFLHPFHPTLQALPQLNSVLLCPACSAIANPLSRVENYSLLRCNFCGTASSIPTYDSMDYQESYAYQFDLQAGQKKGGTRRVCLAIEASQYNFEKKVHKGIISSLMALCELDLEVAIVFFDNKYAYFIDQELLSLTKVALDKEKGVDWDGLPFEEECLFRHISHFSEQVGELMQAIMYEAYYTKQTILPSLASLLQKCLPLQCQIKFFVTTLNQLTQYPQQAKGNGVIGKIFKDKQNVPAQKKTRKSIPDGKTPSYTLSLSQNMQFFVVTQNTTYQQAIDLLGYHLTKAYGFCQSILQSRVYYDLFENMQLGQMVNVELQVRASRCLQLVELQSPSFDLYGRVKLVETQHHRQFRVYKLVIRQCCQTTMLPLRFKLATPSPHGTPCFQITYPLGIGEATKGVVINSSILKVNSESQMGLEWLDDESLFNEHLRLAVAQCGGSFKDMKTSLQAQYQQLVRLFKANYAYDSINFPKTMKHYFLYIFVLLQRLKDGTLNAYSLYRLLGCGLETFSKQLYYRTYRLQGGVLKNIKSSRGVVEKYPVVWMQNGEQLLMVFSQAPVSEIKEIFGYYDSVSSLGNHHYQLPELPSNVNYRRAIQTIRSSNGDSFLRLQIVDLQSSFFECYVAPGLYDKTQHVDFLRRAWKSA